MTAPPPRSPWWKRKRTWATVVLWLVVVYPLSFGPACYLSSRGWIDAEPVAAAYAPVLLWKEEGPFARPFARYAIWWDALGSRHRRERAAASD